MTVERRIKSTTGRRKRSPETGHLEAPQDPNSAATADVADQPVSHGSLADARNMLVDLEIRLERVRRAKAAAVARFDREIELHQDQAAGLKKRMRMLEKEHAVSGKSRVRNPT